MAKAAEPTPVPDMTPLTFRDFPVAEESAPVEVAVLRILDVPEPAKPATKKEN